MFPPGLSMLWERSDPEQALRERFGFSEPVAMHRWLTDVLAEHWSLEVRKVTRIVLSDHNALVWARTDQGRLVVKVCAEREDFSRLAVIADVVTHVGSTGVPVPVPRRSRGGAGRVVVTSDTGELSVLVQPFICGDLLEVADLGGVHEAGACLARLHMAAAHKAPTYRDAGLRVAEADLHSRLGQMIDPGRPAGRAAPRAVARLGHLLADLAPLTSAAGLVHGDFRSTNILMRGAEVAAVLDFDEMVYDFLVLDLARAATLLATRFTTWDPAPVSAQHALLAGYRSVRPLSGPEEAWLGALVLAFTLAQIPDGAEPGGWVRAAEQVRT